MYVYICVCLCVYIFSVCVCINAYMYVHLLIHTYFQMHLVVIRMYLSSYIDVFFSYKTFVFLRVHVIGLYS